MSAKHLELTFCFSCLRNLPSVPKVDPAEWRLEVERVAVQLKVKLPNDNKDWRLHLQQMDYHHEV